MASATSLMTVEEFMKLPEDSGPVYHELRNGVPIAVSRPKLKHHSIQSRVRDLLKAVAPAGSLVEYEVAFRPRPEYELRVADVAYISRDRWIGQDLEDNFRGTPDLVIEVLSPSNTSARMYDKESLCLENGALEFWVIDTDRRQVKVSTPDGVTKTYRPGQEIPLRIFGAVTVGVDQVLR